MTTQIIEKPIEFKGFKEKKIVADFSGGEITSDAGLLMFRELEKKSKIIKEMSSCIQDKREAAKVDHSIEELLKQRVFGLIGGYEDINDHQQLRNDTTFKILCERKTNDTALSSPPTICRFENMVDRNDIIAMSKKLVEQFINSYKTAPTELILDFDASDNPVHGDQENKFFHGYYDEYCFLPLYVFCGKKHILSYLRSAWKGAAQHTWAIL
nr:transposase [bacterium]